MSTAEDPNISSTAYKLIQIKATDYETRSNNEGPDRCPERGTGPKGCVRGDA